MPLRFHPEIEGLTHCWVEIEERWTRREVRELMERDDESTIVKFLRSKVTGCHLERGDGQPPVTTTDELITNIDDLDLRLVDFLGTVLIQAAAILRTLGNLSGRLGSPGSAGQRNRTQTPQKQRRQKR